MSSESSSRSGGIGFLGFLAIVFITLKLTNYIAWSWWWVLAPLWFPAAVVGIVLLFALLIGIALVAMEEMGSKLVCTVVSKRKFA